MPTHQPLPGQQLGDSTPGWAESQASWKPGSEVPGVRNPEPHRPQLTARLSGAPANEGHEGRPLWGLQDTRPTPEKGTSSKTHASTHWGTGTATTAQTLVPHRAGFPSGAQGSEQTSAEAAARTLSGKQQALFELRENSSVISRAKAGHRELLHSAHPGGYSPRGHVVCWGEWDYQAEYD